MLNNKNKKNSINKKLTSDLNLKNVNEWEWN